MKDRDWEALLAALRDPTDMQGAVEAARTLQTHAASEDIPKLVGLLGDESFFVREAAAWPLSDLGATSALPQLLEALHRGVHEGHDNDSLTAALADLAQTHPDAARDELNRVIAGGPPHLSEHAGWLLEFCQVET
jgi:HEAT repeat protein